MTGLFLATLALARLPPRRRSSAPSSPRSTRSATRRSRTSASTAAACAPRSAATSPATSCHAPPAAGGPRRSRRPHRTQGAGRFARKAAIPSLRLRRLPGVGQPRDRRLDHLRVDPRPEAAREPLGRGHCRRRGREIGRDLRLDRRVEAGGGTTRVTSPSAAPRRHRRPAPRRTPRAPAPRRSARARKARSSPGSARAASRSARSGHPRRHHHVADRHQPDAAAVGGAVHPPDHRLAERVQRLQHLRKPPRLGQPPGAVAPTCSCIQSRSPPAQKLRPSPVSTTTRTPSRPRCRAAASPSHRTSRRRGRCASPDGQYEPRDAARIDL